MVDYKIVTLSGYYDIFNQFQASANKYEADTQKIVVKNKDVAFDLTTQDNWSVLDGREPFIFARNANIGIIATGDSDVLLTNDDVQFTRNYSITELVKVAYSSNDIGIVSPVILGGVCNPLQRYSRVVEPNTTILSDNHLAFICVYLKRSVINKVGLLDEQFNRYGGDDVDYCIRMQKAGMRLAITNNMLIQHGYKAKTASSSFSRVDNAMAESIAAMDAKLKYKHNIPDGYHSVEP